MLQSTKDEVLKYLNKGYDELKNELGTDSEMVEMLGEVIDNLSNTEAEEDPEEEGDDYETHMKKECDQRNFI